MLQPLSLQLAFIMLSISSLSGTEAKVRNLLADDGSHFASISQTEMEAYRQSLENEKLQGMDPRDLRPKPAIIRIERRKIPKHIPNVPRAIQKYGDAILRDIDSTTEGRKKHTQVEITAIQKIVEDYWRQNILKLDQLRSIKGQLRNYVLNRLHNEHDIWRDLSGQWDLCLTTHKQTKEAIECKRSPFPVPPQPQQSTQTEKQTRCVHNPYPDPVISTTH